MEERRVSLVPVEEVWIEQGVVGWGWVDEEKEFNSSVLVLLTEYIDKPPDAVSSKVVVPIENNYFRVFF